MTDVKKKTLPSDIINVPFILIVVMMLLTALTELVSQTVLSLGILICCCLLLFYNKLHLAFPFMIFYNSFYGLVFGVSVFRLYTLLVLVDALIRMPKQMTVKSKYLPPFLVYTLYLLLLMIPAIELATTSVLFIEVLCGFIMVSSLTKDSKDELKSFFKVYAVVALISFFTGTLAENTIGDEYSYSRFMATFEDPNYMGFFFTVAIFALVTLKLFDKRIRFVMVVVLYAMIITTLSITAIVVNIALWLFYLIIMKKIKWWSLFVIVLVVAICVSVFNYGLENPDAPVLGAFSARVNEKLGDLERGDMGDFTTNRTDLATQHFDFYVDLPLVNQLFGGVPVNSRYIDPRIGTAAHNEYIDMLLNVGFLGAAVMLGYFIFNTVSYFKKYKKSGEDKYLFLVMGKAAWAFYAASLTIFLDPRFMLLFLI